MAYLQKSVIVGLVSCLTLAAACPETENSGDDDATSSATPTPSPGNAVLIEASLSGSTGRVSALNGVQGGPAPVNDGDPDLSTYYVEASIPIVRLPQDDGFAYTLGGVFPDADADPTLPSSYDFSSIDASIQAIVDVGADVLWEATYDIGGGDRWEGCCQTGEAPSDLDTWSAVVEHVLMHFNEGWADGHTWNVRFVESINEPFQLEVYDRTDYEACWAAFAALSQAVDRYNTRYGRDVQVLGYADPVLSLETGPLTDLSLIDNFLAYVSTEGLTLDGFSYHSYSDPATQADIAAAVRSHLDEAGFDSLPLFLGEWNVGLQADPSEIGDPAVIDAYRASSEVQSRILLQGIVDQAIIYRGNQRGYHGDDTPSDNVFFSEAGVPMPAYYTWLIFRDLEADTPVLVESWAEGALVGLLARTEDTSRIAVVMANWTADPADATTVPYQVTLHDLPTSSTLSTTLHVVDQETRGYDPVETGTLTTDSSGTASIEATLPAWSVHFWTLAK